MRPRSTSAVYSAGPNRNAKPAKAGATSVSATRLIDAAMNEPIAATPSARPALPCSVIAYPSRHVTIDADSPGVLSRIDVVGSPVHRAVIGSREQDDRRRGVHPVVTGSSSAIVAGAPSPGSTPINVPMTAPTSAHPRFHGVSAAPKPSTRLERTSACP
jgi:hypothetical protein